MQFFNIIFCIALAVSAVVANPVSESSDGGSIMKRQYTPRDCYISGFGAGEVKGCDDRVNGIIAREAADELEKRDDCSSSDPGDYQSGYNVGYKTGWDACEEI